MHAPRMGVGIGENRVECLIWSKNMKQLGSLENTEIETNQKERLIYFYI